MRSGEYIRGQIKHQLLGNPAPQSCHYDMAPVKFKDGLAYLQFYLICQPNVMVVGLISLSNMPLTLRKEATYIEIHDCMNWRSGQSAVALSRQGAKSE